MDSFEGNKSDPLTLHKYLYANTNPVNLNDPSGLIGGFTETLTVNGPLQAARAEDARAKTTLGATILPEAIKIAGLQGIVVTGLLLQAAGYIGTGSSYSEEVINYRKDLEKYIGKLVSSSQEKKTPRVLFHYTTMGNARNIYLTAKINTSQRGTFGFGAYATDIPPYDLNFTRATLTIKLFGRNTPDNYSLTEWFVAFTEKKGFEFTKVAPNVYFRDNYAEIYPLTYGANPMNP